MDSSMRLNTAILIRLLCLDVIGVFDFIVFLGIHPRKYVAIFNLGPLVPSALDFSLIHLDHLLVAEIFIMTTLVVVSGGKEQFIAEFFSRYLVVCA